MMQISAIIGMVQFQILRVGSGGVMHKTLGVLLHLDRLVVLMDKGHGMEIGMERVLMHPAFQPFIKTTLVRFILVH